MGSLDIISIMTAKKTLLLTLQISVGLGLRIVDQPSVHLHTNPQQYAPDYSYDNHPSKETQISKLAWALSPKLLPPPPDKVATEDNADEFYKPYYYATEDNADHFYAPYIGEKGIWSNMEADNNNDADSYYIPYLPYA